MAKDKPVSDPAPVSVHSNQPTPPTVPNAWSLEDLGLLSTEQEAMGVKVAAVEVQLPVLLERLAKLEAEVAILDPQRSLLPAEVVKGLSPAEIYKVVLSSGLTALLLGEPHLVDNVKFRGDRIDRILGLCDTVLDRVCIHAGTNLKK